MSGEREPWLADGWPLLVLAGAMVVAAGVILHLTRGFTFYYDEWNFVVNRQYSTSDAFFGPHNEHMVLVPVLIFKALWAVAGLNEYWTFRVVVVALHLLVAGLLYALARRRVGPVLALAPALILLFLGTAWEIILWPFEIQFLIPAAAGLGVLMAIEREDRAGDLVACGLLVLAFASGSLGVPVALGAAVEILFGPRRFTRLLTVVVPPALLYAIWLHEYNPYRHQFGSIGSVPKFATEQLASALAGIAGFRYGTVRTPALVVAIAFIVVLAVHLVRHREGRPRLVALIVMALAYWGALALYRPWVLNQQPSRFLYAGGAFVLLMAVELVKDVRFDRRALAVVGALVVLSVASNADDLRNGAHTLREYSDFVQPGLGALDLARGTVAPSFRPEPTRAPDIVAGRYFEAVDRFGSSPGDTPAKLATRTEPAREAADIVLVSGLRLAMRPAANAGTGAAPKVTLADHGTSSTGASCVSFRPSGGQGALELDLPPGGVTVTACRGPPGPDVPEALRRRLRAQRGRSRRAGLREPRGLRAWPAARPGLPGPTEPYLGPRDPARPGAQALERPPGGHAAGAGLRPLTAGEIGNLGVTQRLRRTVPSGWGGPALLAGLTLLALALRLPRMDDSLGGDELFAYSEIHGHGLAGVVQAVQHSIEVTPPLFFILAWVCMKFGDPSISIRVPSLVLGVGLVPLTYLLGLRTVGRTAGLLAAALVAISPFAIRFSTQGRPYATLMFCVALSTLALLVAIDRGGLRWWALYAVATAAVLYTHYTGVFALAAQTLWAAWRYPRLLRPLAAATGGAAVLFLPWLPQVGSKGQLDNPFYGQLTVTSIGRTGAEVFPGYPQRSPSAGRLAGIRPLIAISVALLVSLAALLSRERGRRSISDEGSRTLLLAALVGAAPVGMLGFSLISGHNVFQGRYLSASFPALALLVAGLICSLRPRVAAVVAAVVLVGVAAGTAKILSSDLRAAEYRKPARYVDAHARAGDVVVQKMRKAGPLSTALIVHFRRPHRVVTVTGVREVPGGYEGTVPPDVWRRAAAGHEVFVIGSEAPPLFFLPRPPKRWAPRVRLLERRRYPGVSRIYLYVYGPRSE